MNLKHQKYNLYGALLPFLVDGSGVAIILVSAIAASVCIRF
jgi:hypothetical protein